METLSKSLDTIDFFFIFELLNGTSKLPNTALPHSWSSVALSLESFRGIISL